MSKTRTLGRLLDNQKADTANTIAALRYQAAAWRICALIGLADKDAGAKFAQWLMFQTVPFVNGEALGKFITENEKRAAEAGKAAGVFS